MSWYPTELVTCPVCWDRFSTPIEQHQHRHLFRGEGGVATCTPTIRRYKRMLREAPELAKRHEHKFPGVKLKPKTT